MKISSYVALALGVVGVIASFMFTRIIWPDVAGAPVPSAGQMPFFIGLSVLESLAFGAGIYFLVVGLMRLRGQSTLTWFTFLATVWFLVSWWPHDNLHRVTAETDLNGLLRIEYGFHVSLMVAGALIAYYLWRTWWAQGQAQ